MSGIQDDMDAGQEDWLSRPEIRDWALSHCTIPPAFHSEERMHLLNVLKAENALLDALKQQAMEITRRIQYTEVNVRRRRVEVSPIRCIPPEMLSLILSFVDVGALPKSLSQINTLCQVCKQWYHTVKSTTELWAAYDIRNVAWEDQRNLEATCDIRQLRDWLTASGSANLSVTISDGKVVRPGFVPTLGIFAPVIERVACFNYSCRPRSEEEKCSGSCFLWLDFLPRAKRLEELKWDVDPRRPLHGGRSRQVAPQLIELRSLRKLTLHNSFRVHSILTIPHLTHLDLYFVKISHAQLAAAGNSSPALRNLSCRGVSLTDVSEEEDICRFPQLTHFSVLQMKTHAVFDSPVLEQIIVKSSPRLYSYRREIGGITNNSWKTVTVVAATVTYLHIGMKALGLYMQSFDLRAWLLTFPNTTHLKLQWQANPREANHYLAVDHSGTLASLILRYLVEESDVMIKLQLIELIDISYSITESPIASGAKTLPLALDNFSWWRSPAPNGEIRASSPAVPCLATLTWARQPTPMPFPDIHRATWLELQPILAQMTEDDDELNSGSDTEEDDYSWDGRDSSESDPEFEEESNGDSDTS